jgi:DNA-binding NarL/FixJ family response regulator
MHESETLIKHVLEAGARGYLLKSDAARDLIPAIEALNKNSTFFTSKVAQMILDGYTGKPRVAVEHRIVMGKISGSLAYRSF